MNRHNIIIKVSSQKPNNSKHPFDSHTPMGSAEISQPWFRCNMDFTIPALPALEDVMTELMCGKCPWNAWLGRRFVPSKLYLYVKFQSEGKSKSEQVYGLWLWLRKA